MNIQPVVEGYGEVKAVPVLLRRLIAEAQSWCIEVRSPIRSTRSQLATKKGIVRAVELARKRGGCGGILLLFDSDDDCPAKLGPQVQEWASGASGDIPCAVCIAHREYEAWFLATADSLRGHKAMKPDAMPHPNPESPRGAKEELGRRCMSVNGYKATKHQPELSGRMCLADAYRRCRSFRKLVASVGTLMQSMGQLPATWPPPHWLDGTTTTTAP